MIEPIEPYIEADATTRLSQLGVRRDDLSISVATGLGRAFQISALAPPGLRGITAWGITVESLRLILVLREWKANDTRNYSTIVHPEGTHAIAVASANSATGRPDQTPSPRSEKGPETRIAITRNQLSFARIDKSFPTPLTYASMDTWLLLYYADEETEETRSELSLPSYMTKEGRVTRWQERIILDPMPFDSINQSAPEAEPTPAEDIPVPRKADQTG